MDVFTAIAEPTRRTIVEMLARSGELSATDISDKFHSSPPAISQHLKVLREARVVVMEKRSRQRIYHINPSAMKELEQWAKQTTALWEKRFGALDKVLEAEQKKLTIKKYYGRSK
jgi:DNA-binding transcriptional ArsR family regulator